ncbi:magnesium and cobalt transport protein CorA [Comamonas testosteroni]|uniref:magnesium and cobalt transport protein CorA n=1 Tax=Comamonas testosteroni TaxID=285 RepID=UPI00265F483F|nr:magnesium and cobalt transport protein CorA [Comamonas testosteroni]WKL18667.1 magnesium and cobalt transport protein CorA [Comamonas testosteroni]WQD45811.1 magnesium and cobalt transport protein CorA [Comamonas testosteroni]
MLINCVAYEKGSKLADIAVADISEYIARPDCFVWVALSDATSAELDEMRAEFNLHELAVEDASHGHQRPKIEEYGQSLFAVMHLLEPDTAQPGQFNLGEVDVFIGSNYVLSVRNRSKQGFLGVRDRCEKEPELLKHGSGFVLYALMDAVVDRYFPIIEALEAELESVELQIFTQRAARESIKQLYGLKQRVMILKHAVAPLLEAVSKLHGGRVPQVCAGSQDYFRDVADHLVRINGLIEGMRDTIATAMQVNLALVTIDESEVTKRLAAWASIFAICTAFVGIWGMNFEHMPELKWQYGYPGSLLLIVCVCSYVYYRFRRAGWL